MSTALLNEVDHELRDIETMFQSLEQAVGMDMREELLALFYPTLDGCLQGLQQAIPAQDAGQIISFAHKLKGAAGQLGATRIAQQSKDIEMQAKRSELSDIAPAFDVLQTLCAAVKAKLLSV